MYFQLEYDVRQEGPLAVVLFKYDKTHSSFEQANLYEAYDGQSTLLQVVPKGTYAISIQSIASSK